MMTRRELLWAAAGIPVLAASQEFWNEKPPDQWTKAEIEQLLTQSPWAKPAAVSFKNSVGNLAPGFGRYGVYSPPGTIDQGKNAGKSLAFQATLRWETALPVRLAEKNHAFDGSQYYVLAAVGDFPATNDANEDIAARQQRREMLQEFTKLERRGDSPLYLDRVESIATGMRFYFQKLEPITLANKELAFTTKIGPLELKAKFPLKDMVYRGQLEL